MSNKRQLKMSASNRVTTFVLCCDLKRVLGLNFVAAILLVLLTSATLIVESAKLEAKTVTETVTKSTKTIKNVANDNHNNYNYNNDNSAAAADEALLLRQQHKDNTLDEAAENFYHSELQRLSYDTIHSILRDENEPIFRREDTDRRYYHAKSLQPTHEIMKREVTELSSNATTATKNVTTNHIKLKPKLENSNFSSKSLTRFNMSAYEHLAIMNLSHNQLSELPAMSANASIVLLDLNSNHIQTAAAPLNRHLKSLFLSGNQIENLAALNLSQLVALETLDLSCNHIQNLETSFFPQLMHNLKFLNLAHNQLGTISRETFYNLLSLNTLLLAHNDITNIDYETFLSLPNLQYLDLSHNQLRGESIRALQGIPDLIGLSIAYNPNMGESLQEFVASWSLKEVDASGTGLCQIPAALAQAVRTLKLADNWLKIINSGDLDSYPLLTHLDLSNSHIEDIEDDAMGRLEFLELLFLDHNRLRKVPVSLPTSLEHLFLQYNEIMDLQVQAFQGLKNLKTLDLSHNKLLYLPALPLPKLLTLNLQASGLQGLNQAIVHTLPHLRDLLLEENPIKCSDLLGIAEWASPCRIAERIVMGGNGGGGGVGGVGVVGATTKSIDSEQIANVADVGQKQQQQQQQMQTVAKIDLKAKFVQTHNFYEKFGESGFGACVGVCTNCIVDGRQMATTTTKTMATTMAMEPPTCAIELEDQVVLKVEKPTTVLTASKNLVGGAAVEQPNVNFNEHHKLAQVEKSTTGEAAAATTAANIVAPSSNPQSMGIMENANHAASTAKMPTTRQTTTATTTTAKSFQTKNVAVIANVTSAVGTAATAIAAVAVMPTTTHFLATNSTVAKNRQISQPTTAEPTTTTATTTSQSFESDVTNSPNLKLLLPTATLTTKQPTKMSTKMPRKMTTKMPTSSSTGATSEATSSKMFATATKLRPSLLERQRRLEATTFTSAATTAPTTTTTTKETLPTFTARTKSHQAENLARNIGNNDSQKMLQQLQQKSSNNSENSNGETKNETVGKLLKVLPSTITTTTLTTTTTVMPPQQQHKHVTLQLNSKDRHLIGTPLLTHHGQNLMVAAEELKKNGNHITAKMAAATTTTTATTIKSPSATSSTAHTTPTSQKQTLDKSQNQQTETEVNKFTKVLDAENVATTTTTTAAIQAESAIISNAKLSKKPLSEQKKKPATTVIMKKMTVTTTATKQQSISTTSPPKAVDKEVVVEAQPEKLHQQHQNHLHHHYTLNTPRENEATLFSGNSFTSAEQPLEPQPPSHHYQNYNNVVKHHSTVNTPVINGHETAPQTFQEHNEIEEEAAAARASISAKFNSKLHASSATQQQQARLHFDNPTVVFVVGMALFVTLVLSLLHAYRCRMPAILNMQRQHQLHQQRPHRQQGYNNGQGEQQGHPMRIRNKNGQTASTAHVVGDYDEQEDSHSFLNGGSNQFQRQWRLERACSSQQQQQQQQVPLQQYQQHQQQQQSSPFHNLQVRDLQQTSAIEPCPRYCKPSYNISSALGERSNSHTSSSCSPHSSCTFDDETCYIEMTTDVGQPIAAAGSTTGSIPHSDLLPMELLNVTRRCDLSELNAHQQLQHQHAQLPISTSQTLNSFAFQTSAIDEIALQDTATAANDDEDASDTKLTPRTRKLGLW